MASTEVYGREFKLDNAGAFVFGRPRSHPGLHGSWKNVTDKKTGVVSENFMPGAYLGSLYMGRVDHATKKNEMLNEAEVVRRIATLATTDFVSSEFKFFTRNCGSFAQAVNRVLQPKYKEPYMLPGQSKYADVLKMSFNGTYPRDLFSSKDCFLVKNENGEELGQASDTKSYVADEEGNFALLPNNHSSGFFCGKHLSGNMEEEEKFASMTADEDEQ